MTTFPQVLYFIQIIPIFALIHSSPICNLYFLLICGYKPPHIHIILLTIPKQDEGIGLPELLQSYRALNLSWVKPWVRLEQECNPVPLSRLTWLIFCHLNSLKIHLIIGATPRLILRLFHSTYLPASLNNGLSTERSRVLCKNHQLIF